MIPVSGARAKGGTGRRGSVAGLADRVWYSRSRLALALVPLSWLFGKAVAARRWLYQIGRLSSFDAGRPVIVVGNVVAGGAGKTPVTLWLARGLKERGLRPGIVSRGYGGAVGTDPLEVLPEADPATVGDEPLMMARRLVCPVIVHPDRVAAARMAVAMGCNVVLADDGLQHYRLERRYELAVVDARRGFGNGRLLPAGPLREPLARLASVDRIMLQDGGRGRGEVEASLPDGVARTVFMLVPGMARELRGGGERELARWRGRRAHAVAGIGDPGRFFRMLEDHGIEVIPHPLADHARLSPGGLRFADGLDVLLTEKDAARLGSERPRGCWYVPVDLEPADGGAEWLDRLARDLLEETAGNG